MVGHLSWHQSALLFEDYSSIAAIATTPVGVAQLQPLQSALATTLWVPASLTDTPQTQTYPGSLKDHLSQLWEQTDAIVVCLAIGAVVRLIAPLLSHKSTDPAVIVVDETGQFVVSLCGGHRAGGDRLTHTIAALLGATPVITGAAQRANLPGIDVLGEPFGWQRGDGDWTAVSAAIARGESVHVLQSGGTTLWRDHLPPEHPFQWDSPVPDATAQVWIGPELPPGDAAISTVAWHPRLLWVGIGCERGTPAAVIDHAIRTVLQAHGLAEAAIAGIATLDLKADEVGLLAVCRDRQLPLQCFTAEQLQAMPVPNPSAVVAAEVGTPSVAEASALLQAQTAIAQAPDTPPAWLRVPKQVVRLPDQPGAVTIAIAQAGQEWTGRTGKLWLVGTGPGDLSQITPAAKGAIATADVVIGYSLYMDLVKPLLRPGQIIETLPITQERQRAERAIALANWGLTVAVISSGDCGIYGMAGLVMEQLQAQGWDGKTPAVRVFPGITALQSAASRVGSPLMHDFCAISLSDLLTPWPVIEKRLLAAAQADFVVALYNPKSQTRTEQIAIAQRIFLQYRSPQTPVALVRSAYRSDETVTLSTLAEFLTHPVDMLTTVLIGNQSTRRHADWMITPRGYLGFESTPVPSCG